MSCARPESEKQQFSMTWHLQQIAMRFTLASKELDDQHADTWELVKAGRLLVADANVCIAVHVSE